jgi:hypothetical protein
MDDFQSPMLVEGYSTLMPAFASAQDPELLREQLLGLMKTEKFYTVENIPCRAIFLPEDDSVPLEEWRRKICQWSFRVIDHFRLDREVVTLGMNIFDRFLLAHPGDENALSRSCSCPSCKRSVDSRTYQLAAMTSLYLAVKLHSAGSEEEFNRRRRFKLCSFVELSRGQFDSKDICAMERTILSTLNWKVNSPTPMTFVTYLLNLLMPPRDLMPPHARNNYDLVMHVLRELSRYLTELAVCLGSDCTSERQSHVGFAAIMVSMDLLTYQALSASVRNAFTRAVVSTCGWTAKELDICKKLRSHLQQALWPEMLLDESEQTDAGHPISMARDYGLLDMDQIYRANYAIQQQKQRSPNRVTSRSLQTQGKTTEYKKTAVNKRIHRVSSTGPCRGRRKKDKSPSN